MVAVTIDPLNLYREMLPAIRGHLANEVQLSPIRNEEEAVKLFRFYLNHAKKEAKNFSQDRHGKEEVIYSCMKIPLDCCFINY